MDKKTIGIALAGVALIVLLIWYSRSSGGTGMTLLPSEGGGGGDVDPNTLMQSRAQGFAELAQLAGMGEANAHELSLARIQASTELDRTRINADANLASTALQSSLARYGMDIQQEIEAGRERTTLAMAEIQARLESSRQTTAVETAGINANAELLAAKNQNSQQTKQLLIQGGTSILNTILQGLLNKQPRSSWPGTSRPIPGVNPGWEPPSWASRTGVTNVRPATRVGNRVYY